MRRQIIATVLRWLFIGFFLALYWWGVGSAIADGRRGDDGKQKWLGAAALTVPWSLATMAYEPAAADQRAWLTAFTVSGALLNSLIFTQAIRRITRGTRRPPDAQAADYRDAAG